MWCTNERRRLEITVRGICRNLAPTSKLRSAPCKRAAMPGNLSVRRPAQDAEKLHPKQAITIDGVICCVSKVKNPSMMAVAAAQGFTGVKIKQGWMPIHRYQPGAHGGLRPKRGSRKRTQKQASCKRASRNSKAPRQTTKTRKQVTEGNVEAARPNTIQFGACDSIYRKPTNRRGTPQADSRAPA